MKLENTLTINDNPFLKASVCRITHEKEHIHKANETDLASPSLAVYQDLPWMNITVIKVKNWKLKERIREFYKSFKTILITF